MAVRKILSKKVSNFAVLKRYYNQGAINTLKQSCRIHNIAEIY